MERLTPIYPQETLTALRTPSIRGRVVGSCDGTVRIEAHTPAQSRPLAAISVRATAADGPTAADKREPEPRFILRVPSDVSLRLRWGCDADDDGRVEGSAVAEAPIGVLNRDLPLDLRLPSDEGIDLVTPVATGTLRLPAGGALVAPQGAVGPPNALAPADGAVGPPLPEGPPANAGPPPPSGTTPPP